jgi:hypothetical protein
MKKSGSLVAKFIGGFVIIGILICLVTTVQGYRQYKTSIQRQYNNTAYDVAEVFHACMTEHDIAGYLAMAEGYKNPSLCNYYCSHECPIGQEYVPEVQFKELSQITLEMLASLNSLEKEKNRLIEITVDGQISDDEIKDFEKIQEQLSQISMAIDSLQLWVQKAIAEGRIDKKD